MEKKIFVKNSLGLKEYPHWKHGVHNFLSEGRVGAQHKIIMPKNEVTVIYDFFRDKPFDRYMANVNGPDRMTIGLWEDIKLREFFRLVGNIILISITFGFGFLLLIHLPCFKRKLFVAFSELISMGNDCLFYSV